MDATRRERQIAASQEEFLAKIAECAGLMAECAGLMAELQGRLDNLFDAPAEGVALWGDAVYVADINALLRRALGRDE